MNIPLKKFILKLFLSSVLVAIIGAIVFHFFIPQYYQPILPIALAVFFILTIISHAYQLVLIQKDIAKFTRMNMILTFLRLLAYSVFTVIYLAVNSQNAISFVAGIMFLYIFFTIFEVSDITRIVQNSKKK